MEEIKINSDNEQITYSSQEVLKQEDLLNKYREKWMEKGIHEKIINTAPDQIRGMHAYVQLTEQSILLNENRQTKIKEVLADSEMNIPKKIQKIRERYTEEELLEKARNLIDKTETIIKKEGDNFLFKTEVIQSPEDLIIEYMTLQDSKPDLLERLANQKKAIKSKEEQIEKSKRMLEQTKEVLRSIEDFFKRQGKEINQLLDEQAKSRKKEDKVAKELPK